MVETIQANKRLDKGSRPYITIACKVAVPWLDLRICEPKEITVQSPAGPRSVIEHHPTGEIIRIHGTAYPVGQTPEGFGERPRMVMGYALTTVPRPLWEKYLAQFKDEDKRPNFLKSNMIFAYESEDDIKAEAKEHSGQLSGLEPIQKTKTGITDKRMPKSTRPEVTDLEPDAARMGQRNPSPVG